MNERIQRYLESVEQYRKVPVFDLGEEIHPFQNTEATHISSTDVTSIFQLNIPQFDDLFDFRITLRPPQRIFYSGSSTNSKNTGRYSLSVEGNTMQILGKIRGQLRQNIIKPLSSTSFDSLIQDEFYTSYGAELNSLLMIFQNKDDAIALLPSEERLAQGKVLYDSKDPLFTCNSAVAAEQISITFLPSSKIRS